MTAGIKHIDLLLEMLTIPSISRKEHKRADFLEEVLTRNGHELLRIHNNLIVGDVNQHDSRPRIL